MDPWLCLTLFCQFALASLIAFGGSQSALPLIERIAVKEMGWATADEFATAVGSSYITPGPIGMVAAFIGYHVGGLAGALSATAGMFFIPWLIAVSAASAVQSMLSNRWMRGFILGASAAVVGLQAALAVDLSRRSFTGAAFIVVGVLSLTFTVAAKVHPILIVLGGAIVGLAAG